MSNTLDLRARCARAACGKLIRKGKQAQAEYARYKPFCSYHCQQWAGTEAGMQRIKELRGASHEQH